MTFFPQDVVTYAPAQTEIELAIKAIANKIFFIFFLFKIKE